MRKLRKKTIVEKDLIRGKYKNFYKLFKCFRF